ncbi:UspA domain-containing protein [Natrialba chahannaoensis JCM 10990]|uniref:UspA domain-containing protein n=1 Tax=Natrialba chahannaoensis JCM 10990 TaxID=1227492 RepID=M0ASA4_9EURY|nr:universal stress protein [Natrialba chahannaoensis]ELZ01202.1 UspA domain-containing protein [Natrialba chahannaoensis JCM 10990]
MTVQQLRRVVVPVANETDARQTYESIRQHVAPDVLIHVVHVIEKAGGAPDKAPLGARQRQAETVFEQALETLEPIGYKVETELRYGRDIIDEIRTVVDEHDGAVIAFVPRESSRLHRVLTGDKTRRLATVGDVPVLVLPEDTS